MVRGRPPNPGTAEERAAVRRERVKNNVRALRARRKQEAVLLSQLSPNKATSPVPLCSNHSRDETHSDSGQSHDQYPLLRRTDTDFTPESSYISSNRNKSKLILGLNVDTKGLYAVALLSCMRESFLPDSVYLPAVADSTSGRPWESDQFLWTPCAFWISRAFTKASGQDSSTLKTVLLATGLMLKSFEYGDNSLRVSALELYRRALLGIKKQLAPLIANTSARPKDSVSLYLACHAAAMFELMLSADLSSTMHHLRGVSQLIYHLGDSRDEEELSTAWLLLQDYRFTEMGLCMKFRYTSFSSIKRQQFEANPLGQLALSNGPAFTPGHGSHNLLVQIADMADDISAIMVQLDSVQSRLHVEHTENKIRQLLTALGAIWTSFGDVYARLIAQHGPFLRKDPDAKGPVAGSFKFKSFEIGAAWCYNLMVQTYCLETSIEAEILYLQVSTTPRFVQGNADLLKHLDEMPVPNFTAVSILDPDLATLRWLHRATCLQLTQCLQYFLQTDKGINGQALSIFPLDAAVCMLAVEMSRLVTDLREAKTSAHNYAKATQIERDIVTIADAQHFCHELQDRARTFGLPVFTSASQDFVQVLRKDQALYG